MNQLVNVKPRVALSATGDLLVDDTCTFEVGGKDKSITQLKNTGNAFIVADDLEIGLLNKMLLWLFGFLY